jgi:hypothetical protein
VHDTQNYWGFWTLTIIQNSKYWKSTTFQKLDPFSFSGEGRETSTLLGLLGGMETDPVSKTLCLLVFRIPDDELSPETQ